MEFFFFKIQEPSNFTRNIHLFGNGSLRSFAVPTSPGPVRQTATMRPREYAPSRQHMLVPNQNGSSNGNQNGGYFNTLPIFSSAQRQGGNQPPVVIPGYQKLVPNSSTSSLKNGSRDDGSGRKSACEAGFMFNVYEWTCHEVENWLAAQKQAHLTAVFAAHRVDGARLMKMTTNEMKQIGIAKDSDRNLLKKKIRELDDVMKMERKLMEKEKKRAKGAASAPATPAATTPVGSAANSPNIAANRKQVLIAQRSNSSANKKREPESPYDDVDELLRADYVQRSAASSDERSLRALVAVANGPNSDDGLSQSRLHRFFRRK